MAAMQHEATLSAAAHRLSLAIFLLLTGFYLLTMSGHLYSPDEETMYAVTRGIALAGDVAVLVEPGVPVAALRPGADGRGYSPYGILPSLLALPFFAVGALLAPADPAAFDYTTRFVLAAFNAPISAATAALLAAWALRLGVGWRAALLLALLYALATFAWVYARTFFSEPLAALLLLIAAERIDAAFHSQTQSAAQRRLALLSAGVAAGLLIATRIASVVALPILALFVLWHSLRLRPVARRGLGFQLRPAAFGPVCIWGLGLLPGVGLVLGYNLLRFGTLLSTGYASEARLFTTPLAYGLYGLLFSPGKSLFLYAPPLILALPGALRLWSHARRLLLLLLGLSLAHLLLYAQWGEWAGGGVWGPRFLLPVVPLLLLLAAGLFLPTRTLDPAARKATLRLGTRCWPWLCGLLAALGFAGNLGGVLLNFNTYLNMPLPVDRINSIADTPLLAHWRIFADRLDRYTFTKPHCALSAGFFASESPSGELLPRRTGATGTISCKLDAPSVVLLTLDDRRPQGAPGSALSLALNGQAPQPQPVGQVRNYRLLLPSGHSDIHFMAQTWNPLRSGFSDRNDNLGVVLTSVLLRQLDGSTLPLVDRAIAPLPQQPRPRWAWYYDPPNQHLIDHWAWYLPRSELPADAQTRLALVLSSLALACVLLGSWQSGTIAVNGNGIRPRVKRT